jgi:type II restriction/modification system DNA methylase subunit YeeA
MSPAEFKKKWSRYQGKETSAYQSHFDDLCRLLGELTPNEADPSGTDFFCFQKRVVKDAELFDLNEKPDAGDPHERGFADVWKKSCFAWEYKGKKKNLDEAYKQLLRYRESLQNPPLLVVCDFERYIVKTNFNGTVQEIHEFTNNEIDRPENLRILRALFSNPEFLKPQRTTAEVTEVLAAKIAEVARLLQKRESVEIADAKTRKELNFASRKNLRIARFLNRIVFCMFAEDTHLLPPNLFAEILKTATDDPSHFAKTLESLFQVMAKGGTFGQHKIRFFNGHLFEEATVFELNEAELKILIEAAEADWQFIQPSIMGTLFERALDESQRSQLGAHYTSEADIRTLVEPVLMSPLRREWLALKGELTSALKQGKGSKEQRDNLAAFLKKLSSITVLDPACGSGNFLYVSLQLLLGLEKEVITFATQIGFSFKPQVSVEQLKAIEINPYAYELAQVSVQIGYLQWRRDNGFDNDRSPVLRVLDGFENKDALMYETFKKKAKNLKAAREEEHQGQENLFKVYVERAWPDCDVIVGNPPFLGDKLMRGELGDRYVDELRYIYGDRIPGQSDFCCYWFEKARDLIENGKCQRAGLLATQGIRGGANREVLKRIKGTGDIFFAESDREWILAGATVHVSMVGFDNGIELYRELDGKIVSLIPANLSGGTDITMCAFLRENTETGFIGVSMHGPFDMDESKGLEMLFESGNPNLRPNSDAVRPVLNAYEITKRSDRRWLVSFPPDSKVEDVAGYDAPMKFIRENVQPVRAQNHRKAYRERWWLPGEARPAMQQALKILPRFLATPRVSKHRIFVWITPESLPSDATVAFARSDDVFMGIVHSKFHEVWSLAQGTQLREMESGFRYTPTTCFETFPFPHGTSAQDTATAAAAKELNILRERWLNPPEWTTQKILEFPGSFMGPWSRYLDSKNADSEKGIGTVRFPHLEPKDADCAAKLKKRTLTTLYNERPAWLDLAHKKLDAAVASAYGWEDFTEIFNHSGPGMIYSFEDGGWRLLDTDLAGLTEAHEKFEKEFTEKILERLLSLNLERAAEEAKVVKPKKSKVSRSKASDEMI